RWLRFRDPAPPASSPRWGFGGGGDRRRTTEGDPDDKSKVEAQAHIRHKRRQDQAQGHTSQARYTAGGSSAAPVHAADCTARKQKGSHHCNVASASWRDHRGDGTCREMATPFGPRLS